MKKCDLAILLVHIVKQNTSRTKVQTLGSVSKWPEEGKVKRGPDLMQYYSK